MAVPNKAIVSKKCQNAGILKTQAEPGSGPGLPELKPGRGLEGMEEVLSLRKRRKTLLRSNVCSAHYLTSHLWPPRRDWEHPFLLLPSVVGLDIYFQM